MDTQISRNKQNAIAFYDMAFGGDPRRAVELYVGDAYIQHNPEVESGPEAFIAYFEKLAQEYPNKSIEFVRAVAEADLVAVHTHQKWPGFNDYVSIDIFRFDENGKIVEHWDAIQEIPENKTNKNTMY